MDTISKRLKFVRLKKGWTQGQLAAAAGVSQGTIGNIESGARQAKASLIEICEPLGVTYKWLATGEGVMDNSKTNIHPAQSRARVPLVSLLDAAMLDNINNHIKDDVEFVEAWHSSPSRDAFAVVVEGDSMTASAGQSFPDGCTLIVDPSRAAKAGDYVVARVGAGTGQPATFKRLVADSGRWFLQPLNTAYPMTQIGDITCVVGVVIEWQVGGKL